MLNDRGPQRINPGDNIGLLDDDQRDLYNSWYKTMPKNDREEIPMALLMQQMNREPFYDFDEASTIFAAKDENDKFAAGGKVLGCTLKDGRRFGELAEVYVAPEQRRLGIAAKIDQKRQEWCTGKFEWLQTHIASTNVPSLRLKIKQGFVLKDVVADPNKKVGSCLLIKKATKDTNTAIKNQTSIVSLADVKKIEQYTTDGWEGVDLQPVADEQNIDSANWLITLRKKD